jgi:hypothetical protein
MTLLRIPHIERHPLTARATTLLVLLSVAAFATAGCQPRVASGSRTGPSRAQSPSALDVYDPVVVDWNNAAYEAFKAEKYPSGLNAVRVIAMVHIAQHDALAAIRPVYATYALAPSAPDGADPVAAAASAAFEVLAAALPNQRSALQQRLAATLAAIADGAAKHDGIAVGARAAAAILDRRRDDGSDIELIVHVPREQKRRPGAYRPIPPADYLFAPGWRDLKPFALEDAGQFRAPPPPALDSATYAAAFQEVKAIGGKSSRARSAEQTAYAKFWWEFSEIGWNRIGRVVASERKLGLQASARLFALLNMALSDAYVAGWDSKLHYDFWRPTTAIRAADIDGNPATEPDPRWESAELTPPVHDYVSTHSALGNAGAAVLASVFGDATPFAFTSTTGEPGTSRRFTSFSQAADENADSRVQGGLHFRFSCEAGQALGRQVGSWVVATALRAPASLASSR